MCWEKKPHARQIKRSIVYCLGWTGWILKVHIYPEQLILNRIKGQCRFRERAGSFQVFFLLEKFLLSTCIKHPVRMYVWRNTHTQTYIHTQVMCTILHASRYSAKVIEKRRNNILLKRKAGRDADADGNKSQAQSAYTNNLHFQSLHGSNLSPRLKLFSWLASGYMDEFVDDMTWSTSQDKKEKTREYFLVQNNTRTWRRRITFAYIGNV